MQRIGGRFTLIYFVLLFTGLAFSAFGYRFGVWGFFIAGILWIMVTPFAVRTSVPAEIRKWSILFLLVGAVLGILSGWAFGETLKPLIGLVGGAMIGGVGGWLLFVLVLDWVHIVLETFLPKLSTIILYIVFLLGAILGAIVLGDVIPKYFETAGGGLLVGGVFGSFLGILQGAEVVRRQTEECIHNL
jgi:hypothetical protein